MNWFTLPPCGIKESKRLADRAANAFTHGAIVLAQEQSLKPRGEGWRDGPAVNSRGCSSGRPGFDY